MEHDIGSPSAYVGRIKRSSVYTEGYMKINNVIS